MRNWFIGFDPPAAPWYYGSIATNLSMSDYTDYIKAKGYTVEECRRPAKREVPSHLQDRYKNYEEYEAAIHEFLNGN